MKTHFRLDSLSAVNKFVHRNFLYVCARAYEGPYVTVGVDEANGWKIDFSECRSFAFHSLLFSVLAHVTVFCHTDIEHSEMVSTRREILEHHPPRDIDRQGKEGKM